MAAINKLKCRYYSDFKDFVVWCITYKPSLLNNFYYPFMSATEWDDLKYSNNADGVRSVNSITDDIMISQITNKVSEIELNLDVCDNEIELKLGDYEIEVRDGKTYAILKKPTYPKTYNECYNILNEFNFTNPEKYDFEFDWRCKIKNKDYGKLMQSFVKLYICRNAYWKIAGEQMGLGKPWKPDWKDGSDKYFICYLKNELWMSNIRDCNRFLVFPTAEMRDAFYENFKDLIEECKELL